MSGLRSRRKGAGGERELAAIFRRYQFPVERVPNSGGLWIPGDLSGLDGYHMEVKRQETLSLPSWIKQAEADCPDGQIPTVSFRRNHGSVPDKWWTAMPTVDGFIPLLRYSQVRHMVCDCGTLLAATDGEFLCPNCGLAY